MAYASDLWERRFHEVGEYPDIERDYAHIDATCMWMVKNPERFNVIVTDSLFADIITDQAAVIQVLTRDLKRLEAGKMGHSTSKVGDLVVQYLATA
jgi:hypothetical protein